MKHDFVADPLVKSAPVPRWKSALATATGLSLVWAGLHHDDPQSWFIGGPSVALGAASVYALPSTPRHGLSLRGCLAAAPQLAVGILAGAADVAWRCVVPHTVTPGIVTYRTGLPDGAPRRFFALAITLLPGTLTARLDGATLTVHALTDGPKTRDGLAQLESVVARMFALQKSGEPS